jgi:hypothetical protein
MKKTRFNFLRKKSMALLLPCALALFSACNDENNSSYSGSRSVGFEALSDKPLSTKAAEVTSASLADFRVTAVKQGETSAMPNLNGVTVTGGTGSWTYTPKELWPLSGMLDFYAYSPAASAAVTPAFTFEANPASSVTAIGYAVPADPAQQEDLVVAVTKNVSAAGHPALVNMHFQHVLSRIQLKARPKGASEFKIYSMSLLNLKDEGTLKLSADSIPAAGGFVYNDNWPDVTGLPVKKYKTLWDIDGGEAADQSYTVDFASGVNVVSLGGAYTDILVNDDALMILPQGTALGTLSGPTDYTGPSAPATPDGNFYVKLVYSDEVAAAGVKKVIFFPVVEPLDPASNRPIVFEAGRKYTFVVDLSGSEVIDFSTSMSGWNDAFNTPYPPYTDITPDPDPALNFNYQPAAHAGFAGSNIYWDGTRLTFDAVGETAHEQYQGVFFKQGSLVGIDPVTTPYDGTVTLYLPNSTNGNYLSGTATSFGLADWTSIQTGLGSLDGSTLGGGSLSAAEQRLYAPVTWLSGVLNPDWLTATTGNRATFRGDICAYLSGRPGVPAGYWRMPTSDDFGEEADYTRVQGSNTPSGAFNPVITTDTDGTGVIDNGYSFTDPKAGSTVFFPASGRRRDSSGDLSNVGVFGLLWSSSPYLTKGYAMGFQGGINPSHGDPVRSYSFPVRCVRKK